MSSTEFKKRVYGCVVVKAVNANYNADFNGLPRRLKSDGSFYATDKSFKWLVRNYIKKNYENEKVLFRKIYDDKFVDTVDLKKAFELITETTELKDLKKKDILPKLTDCIDVRLFGAVFSPENAKKTKSDENKSISVHGVVQVNHAIDLFGKGKVYTDEILAPFTSIGSMSKATEAHYIHNFSINPKNLSSWKNVIKKEEDEKEKSLLDDGKENSLKVLSQSDINILKNSFNNAATFYDSHSKSGVENELSIYVTLNENSILTLPNFAQFITFKKGENGEKNSFDISGLIKYLTKHDEEIASIDIYYIEELTTLVFDNQNSKIKIFDLTKTI
jgi:CRISPR-associated protein Csh2